VTDNTPGAEWARLCAEWHVAHNAALNFPLFEHGWMVNDRLDEWNRLNAVEKEVRGRMDAYLAITPLRRA